MSSRLEIGQSLNIGESILSDNHLYELCMQSDGNLVLYRKRDSKATWSSGTHGRTAERVVMQGDGNLVIYGPSGAIWNSNTWNLRTADYLRVQDDGDLVIFSKGLDAWGTGTNDLGPCPAGCIDKQVPAGDWRTLETCFGMSSMATFRGPAQARVKISKWLFSSDEQELDGVSFKYLKSSVGKIQFSYRRTITIRYGWQNLGGGAISLPPIKF